MMKAHKTILSQLTSGLDANNVLNIFDAGSGRTSLGLLLSTFRNAVIDAVVFPGDFRKIDSIRRCIGENERYNLIEADLCRNLFIKHYDLAVAHLLLGEAIKFGNSFTLLFRKLMEVESEYLILIDYLEDKDIDIAAIETYFVENGFSIIQKVIVENQEPQEFGDFSGIHNFGYLVRRNSHTFGGGAFSSLSGGGTKGESY